MGLLKCTILQIFGILISLCFAMTTKLDQDAQTPTCKPLASPPTGSFCHASGKFAKKSSVQILNDPSEAATFEECLNLCARRREPTKYIGDFGAQGGCVSFGYSKKDHKCTMYYNYLGAMSFQRGKSDTDVEYSDLKCFKCPNICQNQPLGVNLMDNTGFESKLIGPWTNEYGCQVSSPGFKSSHLGQCGFNPGYLRQQYITCPGNFYRLRFDYRISPGSTKAKVITLGTEGFSVDYPGNGNKTIAEFWYEPVDNQVDSVSIFYYPQKGPKQYLNLDNFEVVRVSGAFKSIPKAPEMVPNGGFESGKIAPWKPKTVLSSSFRIESPGINSKHGIRYLGSARKISSLSQTFSVRKGVPYLLTYNAKKGPTTENFPQPFFNGLNMFLPKTQMSGNNLNFSVPFRPVVDQVHLDFHFYGGSVLLDNISLKELDDSQA